MSNNCDYVKHLCNIFSLSVTKNLSINSDDNNYEMKPRQNSS